MSAVSRVGWASVATETSMGQQRYEFEIQRAMRQLDENAWYFRTLTMTSLRSSLPAARRIPRGLAERGPRPVSGAVAAWAYRGVDLVHRFDLRLPAARREVVTVHDLVPLRFPDEGRIPQSAARSLGRAAAVIAPSKFAASEIESLFGIAGVRVIPHGVADAFHEPAQFGDADLARLGVRAPYVLHTSGSSERKNLAGLAAAWAATRDMCPGVNLALCGPTDLRRSQLFDSLPGVFALGFVDQPDLIGLMARADAVVVPSTHEGFGLPALEAMACGTPVVAAAAGALPEVCGDAAVLVEPTAEGIARGLVGVLTDNTLRARLGAEGLRRASSFSWQLAARQHLDVYAEALR